MCYLRSQISEKCLNNLVILNIESDLTESVNYDSSVIDSLWTNFCMAKNINI